MVQNKWQKKKICLKQPLFYESGIRHSMDCLFLFTVSGSSAETVEAWGLESVEDMIIHNLGGPSSEQQFQNTDTQPFLAAFVSSQHTD